jgi:hypothetical protein
MIYTHTVKSRTLKEAKSPLDFLEKPLEETLGQLVFVVEREMQRCRRVWKDWIPAFAGMTDKGLRAEGYKVLRFWDNQVFSNLEGVLETIRDALLTPHPDPWSPSAPPEAGKPLPQGERGHNF